MFVVAEDRFRSPFDKNIIRAFDVYRVGSRAEGHKLRRAILEHADYESVRLTDKPPQGGDRVRVRVVRRGQFDWYKGEAR